jgi:hypothetical protein
MNKRSSGIMMKINVPNMVPIQLRQLEWLEWIFTREDGKKFLLWTGVSDDMKRGLLDIANDGEYDEANDKGILNDMIGLYREWSRDTGIKWR